MQNENERTSFLKKGDLIRSESKINTGKMTSTKRPIDKTEPVAGGIISIAKVKILNPGEGRRFIPQSDSMKTKTQIRVSILKTSALGDDNSC